MKIAFWILSAVAAATAPVFAKTFVYPDAGVRITVPSHWIHDPADAFGYVIRDPLAKSELKIRIHLSSPRFKSAADAVEGTLSHINQSRTSAGRPPEKLLYSEPVVTKSGIPGVKAAHGSDPQSTLPYIIHYYFENPAKRVFCVCLYVDSDPGVAKAYEKILLDSLAWNNDGSVKTAVDKDQPGGKQLVP